MSDVRIAIIGVGAQGRDHAEALDQTEGACVVALCDPDPDAAKKYPVRLQRSTADWHRDRREVLARDDVDAVLIAAPDNHHPEIAIDCLRAGKHLFLEKPVANTLAGSDAIAAAANETDRIVQIGLVYRCSNLYRRMAKICREDLGGATMMWCKELRQCFPQRYWFYEQSSTGGTMVEKDCHHFDLFNWMIGSDPLRVFATGGQHVWRRGVPVEIDCSYCPLPPATYDDIDVIDHAFVTIDYANGAKANLMLCMYLVPHNLTPEGLEVGAIGRNGLLLQANRDKTLVLTGGREEPLVRPIDVDSDSVNGAHIGFRKQHVEFIESVQTGKAPAADLAVGRASILIALAAEESIRVGRPVDLHEFQEMSKREVATT